MVKIITTKYHFYWCGRHKVIEAVTKQDAMTIFMERYGFFPFDSAVSITEMGD